MQYKNVIFPPYTALTLAQLQALAGNNVYINQKKLECEYRNVNPENKKARKANKYIVNNIGFYSKLEVVKAGGKLIKDNKGYKNSFKVTSKFPAGYFNDKFLPVPFVTLQKNFNMPLLINVDNITPNNITYTIFLLKKKKDIDPDKVFEINIMAVGVINPVDETEDSILPDDTSGGGVPSPTSPGYADVSPDDIINAKPPSLPWVDRPRFDPRPPPPTTTPPPPPKPKQKHTHQHGGKNTRFHHGVDHSKGPHRGKHTHEHKK